MVVEEEDTMTITIDAREEDPVVGEDEEASRMIDEEATTTSALVGLKAELEKVEEMIKEKHAQIRFAKASLLRHDASVERLLSQVVRA